jgi:hypothetical protein
MRRIRQSLRLVWWWLGYRGVYRCCLAWQRIGQRRQAPVLREARHLEVGDMVDTWCMGRGGPHQYLTVTTLSGHADGTGPLYVELGSAFGTYVSRVDVFWCKPRIRAPWYRWRSQQPDQREVRA